MAFTTPRTWVTGELITASIMNTHIRDNLLYLISRNLFYVLESTSTYTTTSTTFTAVHANFSKTVTTSGGTVVLYLSGILSSSASVATYIGVSVDGATPTNYNYYQTANANADYRGHFSLVIYVTGLSAASHSFNVQWQTASGTATITKTYAPFTYAGWEV